MAAVTVTIRKYDYKTMTLVQTGGFTFTPSSARLTFGVRGITWDGAHLLFTTTRSTGSAASSPQLLTVDPKTFGLLNNYTLSLSTTRNLLDVAWTGAGMVGLVELIGFSGSTFELWAIVGGLKKARGARILNNSLPAYSRGIAWDGAHAWVTSPSTSPGSDVFYQYDGVSGTLLRSTVSTASAGYIGGGVIWDGAHLFEKHDPTLYFTRVYSRYNVTPTTLPPAKTITGAADNATEQGPIAFDGAFIYEFDSSL